MIKGARTIGTNRTFGPLLFYVCSAPYNRRSGLNVGLSAEILLFRDTRDQQTRLVALPIPRTLIVMYCGCRDN